MAPFKNSRPPSWRDKKQFLKGKKWQRFERNLKKELPLNEDVANGNTSANSYTATRAFQHLKTAPTLSIALPGSILENVQSDQLRSYVAGQIGRAASIYNVNEIIVYDDTRNFQNNSSRERTADSWESCTLLAKILEFLECPQYLRKYLYPMSEEFKYAGLLNPLDSPHHLRLSDDSPFREGVVSDKVSKSGTKSYAEIGLNEEIRIDTLLPENTRVTLQLYRSKKKEKLRGRVVEKAVPQREEGLYWGYSVRLAKRLSDVFTESPFEEDYDLTFGTSDRGQPWSTLQPPLIAASSPPGKKHVLIVFGGVKGLEFALSNDDKLSGFVDDVSTLFDAYVNTCPAQGSRTIRTEEAILISLAVMAHKLTGVL